MTDIDNLVRLVVRAAALRPENAMEDFIDSLCREVKETKEMFKTSEDMKQYPENIQAGAVIEFESMLWKSVFEYIAAAKKQTPDDLMLPLGAWKDDARAMGVMFARDMAKIAPIADRVFKPEYSKFKRKVKARATEITASWPVSRKIQTAVAQHMVAAAEDAIMETLSSLTPGSFSENWGRQ